MPKISVSDKSPAALAPLTFCAAGLAAVESAEGAFTVVDVGVTLDAATSSISQSQSTFLVLPGALGFFFSHVGSTNAGAPGGAAFAVPGTSVFVAGFAATTYNYAFNIALGAAVSGFGFITAPATMAYTVGFPNEEFLTAGTGYVGFRFDLGGGAQFGWVEVVMNGAPHNAMEVVRYGYGDVGDVVLVGRIPEPNSISLLALGASGVLARRRRRKAD